MFYLRKLKKGGSLIGVFAFLLGGNLGGNGQLRPLSWTADTGNTVDGMSGNNWDNSGGTCNFVYGTDWPGIKSCHQGATITSIFVVNDSGWAYPNTGEQVTLDNITVNNLIATGKGNNN